MDINTPIPIIPEHYKDEFKVHHITEGSKEVLLGNEHKVLCAKLDLKYNPHNTDIFNEILSKIDQIMKFDDSLRNEDCLLMKLNNQIIYLNQQNYTMNNSDTFYEYLNNIIRPEFHSLLGKLKTICSPIIYRNDNTGGNAQNTIRSPQNSISVALDYISNLEKTILFMNQQFLSLNNKYINFKSEISTIISDGVPQIEKGKLKNLNNNKNISTNTSNNITCNISDDEVLSQLKFIIKKAISDNELISQNKPIFLRQQNEIMKLFDESNHVKNELENVKITNIKLAHQTQELLNDKNELLNQIHYNSSKSKVSIKPDDNMTTFNSDRLVKRSSLIDNSRIGNNGGGQNGNLCPNNNTTGSSLISNVNNSKLINLNKKQYEEINDAILLLYYRNNKDRTDMNQIKNQIIKLIDRYNFKKMNTKPKSELLNSNTVSLINILSSLLEQYKIDLDSISNKYENIQNDPIKSVNYHYNKGTGTNKIDNNKNSLFNINQLEKSYKLTTLDTGNLLRSLNNEVDVLDRFYNEIK